MFAKIADKGIGLIGQAFVLAGLLPAALIVCGAALIGGGPGRIATMVNEASTGGAKVGTVLLVLALACISFLIYVLRSQIVECWANPAPLLPGRLRSWLENRALRRRHAIEAAQEQLETEYSAVQFFRSQEETCGFVPEGICVKRWEEIDSRLAEARECVKRAAREGRGHLNGGDLASVRWALSEGFVFGSRHAENGRWKVELKAWRELETEPAKVLREALDGLVDQIPREIAEKVEALGQYPEARWIKITEFGNRLSALEGYADRRYGVPTGELWDRTWWLLSKEQREDVADSRVLVETLMSSSVSLWVLAAFAASVTAWNAVAGTGAQDTYVRSAGLTLAFALLAYILYRAGVYAVGGLARMIRSLIDVQVLALVRSMGFSPGTVGDLSGLLRELRDFFLYGKQMDPKRTIEPPKGAGTKVRDAV